MKPKVMTYHHTYAGSVSLPKLAFGHPKMVQDLQVHLAHPTGNNMQIVGGHLARGHSPFDATRELSDSEKMEWSLLLETANKERLSAITFDDIVDRNLLDDTTENRTKFDQLFSARNLGTAIFQRS